MTQREAVELWGHAVDADDEFFQYAVEEGLTGAGCAEDRAHVAAFLRAWADAMEGKND